MSAPLRRARPVVAGRTRLALLCIALCITCPAGQAGVLGAVSPKLHRFLTDHPATLQVLTKALSEASAHRKLELYYFYSDDDSTPGAYHYSSRYGDSSAVTIVVRENQSTLDEFICLLFETLNSQGTERFAELSRQAQTGKIPKTEFVRGVLRQEYDASMKTRQLLVNLNFTRREIAKSHSYGFLIKCPDTFEEFLRVCSKGASSGGRDLVKEYEMKYDDLQSRENRN